MTQIFDKKCGITWPNRASAYGHFMKSKEHKIYPRNWSLQTEEGLQYNCYQETSTHPVVYTPFEHNLPYETYIKKLAFMKKITPNQQSLEQWIE